MELTEQHLAQRIERARQRVGLSQAQLAEAVGLSQSAISRIESGARAVSSLELAAIADHLGVSVVALLEARPLAEELHLAARDLPDDLSGAQKALGRVVDLARFAQLLRSLEVQWDGRAAPAQVPRTRGSAAVQGRGLARWARDWWGLADDPLPNLLSVIEEQAGLPVALEPLNEQVAGLVARLGDTAIALVDSSVALGRQRFTAAHELCHHLCGDGERLRIDRTLLGDAFEERRANAFAAHFLMPEEAIGRYVRGREVDDRVVADLQYTFGVSLDALLWQLVSLRLIDRARRDELMAVGPRTLAFRHGYRAEWEQAESQRGLRRPPSLMYQGALEAYSRGLIGIDAVADFAGRTDADALRRELEDSGVSFDERWWDTGAVA